jgi:hypothetical protein
MAENKNILTPKMIKACEGYIRGRSMREAMIEAGYAKTYVEGTVATMRFFKNRQVIEYIRKRQDQIAKAASLDASECIEAARRIVADNDPRDRHKGLELLMRMGIPIGDPATLTKDDIKSISINFTEAK